MATRGMALLVQSVLAVVPANSSEVVIEFSPVKDCRLLEELEESSDKEFSCKGPMGTDVWIGAGHDSTQWSAGRKASSECLASQSFMSYSSFDPDVAWYSTNGTVFAVAQSWYVYDQFSNSKSTRWNVVSQILEGNSCRVGYIRNDVTDSGQWIDRLAKRLKSEPFDCRTGQAQVIPLIDVFDDVHGMHIDCLNK